MEQHYVVPNIYHDMSDQNQGYFAFRFVCQQCSWQIDTRPIRSSVSTVSNIADIGIGFLGGFWGRAAEAGQKLYGSQWHQEQAEALQKAWREVESHFHFCPRCQQTVCSRCFNQRLNLCLRDAPNLQADGAQFKHEMNIEAQRQQIQQQYTPPQFSVNAIPSAAPAAQLPPSSAQSQPALAAPQAGVQISCPQCQQPGIAGKFCQHCGTRLPVVQAEPKCTGCGARNEQGARFCQECGQKLA